MSIEQRFTAVVERLLSNQVLVDCPLFANGRPRTLILSRNWTTRKAPPPSPPLATGYLFIYKKNTVKKKRQKEKEAALRIPVEWTFGGEGREQQQ